MCLRKWPRMPYRCKDSKYFGKCKRRGKELGDYMIFDPIVIKVKNERMREICRRPTDRRGGNERIIFMQMNWQVFVASDETWNCLQSFFLSRIWELENFGNCYGGDIELLRICRSDTGVCPYSWQSENRLQRCFFIKNLRIRELSSCKWIDKNSSQATRHEIACKFFSNSQ